MITSMTSLRKVFTSQSTGTLSDGSVLFAGGGEIKQDNANFKWDDTNNRLGIGTVTPGYPLHVVGKIYSSTEGQFGNTIAKNNSGVATFGSNSTATTIKINLDASASRNDLVIEGSTGDVGIGTNTPASKLHVNGGSKYFGGGDWTTIERVTAVQAEYALYVQTTGTNTNQGIAKFNYGATAGSANTGTTVFTVNRGTSCFVGNLEINGNEVWHAGNDGAGSGLDADLLDAQHGAYYLNYNNFTNTPTIPTVPDSYAPTDAEANVQADWTETTTTSDAYILNKPATFAPSAHDHDSTYVKLTSSEEQEISGDVLFNDTVQFDGDVQNITSTTAVNIQTTGGAMLVLKDTNSAGVAANPYINFVDSSNTRVGYIGIGSTGNSKLYLEGLGGIQTNNPLSVTPAVNEFPKAT